MTDSDLTRLTSGGLARFGEIAAAHAPGGAPVQRDPLLPLSAPTKPITGALTLALVREGLLTLDEPVDRLLPELADRRVLRRMDGPLDDTVPAARPVTVRDLLTFTFGFGTMLEMFDAEEDWPVDVAESRLPTATLGPPNPARQPDPDAPVRAAGDARHRVLRGRYDAAGDGL